ncbi:MAG: efflux RND transporter permease subunit [Thermoanaerobaculia bacterium]
MSVLLGLLHRPRLVVATALLLALAGLISWNTMPREEDPRFPERNGLVVTTFPGADAEAVERLVVEPLEERLAEVEEIREVRSIARAGVAILDIEMQDHIYDTDSVWDEVEDALRRARHDFPHGVSEPLLDDDLVSQEAVVLALTGSPDPLVLSRAAKRVQRRLLALRSVKQVELVADPGEQITIEYDDAVARRLGLDPRLLGLQLSGRAAIQPGGVIYLGAKAANLTPRTEFTSVAEIAATPVLLPSGSSVPLGEVARVRHGPREPAVERMRFQGEPAIGLGVIPVDQIDRVRFGQLVRQRLAELAPELEPITIREVVFQPDHVASRLQGLTRSLRLGIFIVAAVLLIAMGWRMGLLVAVIVPLVAFSSIALYSAFGGILHQISIAALVIALGMLVDNAIVVVENIQWRLDRGLQVRQAAAEAVRELALPLGTATGTTLAAFVPMLLAQGGTADFTRAIPTLIMLTLSVSYLFAVLVTPVLSELLLRRRDDGAASSSAGSRPGPDRILGLADRASHFAVTRPGWVLAGTAVLLAVTLVAAGAVERQFFPAADRSQVIVDLRMPEGTHLDETDGVALTFETALRELPEVTSVATFVGRSAPHFYYNLPSLPNSPHLAQLVVETDSLDAVERVIAWSRDFVHDRLPEVEVVAQRLEQGPPIAAPIEVRLLGSDLEDMERAADGMLALLRSIPGTRDVRHDLGLGVPTVTFEIDDAAAARHGLSRSDVASVLLGRTLGLEIGQYRMGDDPVPILVRSSAGEELSVADLATVDVATPGGEPVPLAQLARVAVEWRPAAIRHRHRSREVRVLAQVAEGVTAASVLEALEARLGEFELPAGFRLEVGGEAEESGAANVAMLRAAPLGMLLLLFFLLAEFNSFRRVGIVLVTVPLAATGVVPGLLLSGQPFGFTSLLGVIALVGIVVNNAIVLLDVLESLRTAGLPIDEALREAVRRRTRPILLTMATTVAGLLPLAFSNTSLWPPLAWAMISGLIASTFLTLLVLPALYKVLFDPPRWLGADRVRRIFGRRRAAMAAAAVLICSALPALPVLGESEPPANVTLAEAMERAASRPQATAAAARAAAAESAAVVERRLARWPTVGVRADLVRRDRDFEFDTPLGSFSLGERTSDSTAVEVTQPLLDPPRWFYAVPAARSRAAAAADRAFRVRQQLAAEAARSFLTVLAVDARLRSTDAFIESLRARLAETEERVAAGSALESDALKVRLDFESAELDRLALVATRRVAVRDLGRAIGTDGPVEPRFDGRHDRDRELESEKLTRRALAERPDVKAFVAEIRSLELRAGAVKAERWPRLEARAAWVRSSGDPFHPEELLQGSVGLAWAPFAAGTRAPRVAAVDAERQALEADLAELLRAIAVEVEGALARLRTARAAVAVRRRGVELAAETLRVERERHAAGRSTTNDLLEAEAELRLQRTESEIARLDVLRAWVRLQLTAGVELL